MIEEYVAGKTIVMVSASSRQVETIESATCRIKVLEAVSAEIIHSDHIRERMKAKMKQEKHYETYSAPTSAKR
jgi:hypothetical protein